MIRRGFAGLLAVSGVAVLANQFVTGRIGLATVGELFAFVAFGIYAVGGQPQLERIFPMFKPKGPPKDPPQPR